MKLTDTPLTALLAAFRSPSPTPGGGSASALAGALGASLLAMVASMPKHRAASEEDIDRLQAAAQRCTELSHQLTGLVDRDSEAYDLVVAGYRLPKASEGEKAERAARIQQALRTAVDVPLEVMRRCSEAIEAGAIVATFGNPNAASDVGVGLELLLAAERGARFNVEINLAALKDEAYVARVRQQSATLDSECAAGADAIRARLASSH